MYWPVSCLLLVYAHTIYFISKLHASNCCTHSHNLTAGLTHSVTVFRSFKHPRKGTLDYLSPEMIDSGKTGHGHGVDIWALGVLCYELINGTPPFETTSHSQTYKKILECDLKFNKLFSDGSADLITKVRYCCFVSYFYSCSIDSCVQLLKRKPQDRMPLAEVQNHPWIRKHVYSKTKTTRA